LKPDEAAFEEILFFSAVRGTVDRTAAAAAALPIN
jgi:hypothetical protein